MITADELRKRAELQTVVRISDEEALELAEFLEEEPALRESYARELQLYRSALVEIAGFGDDYGGPVDHMTAIAEKALGYTE